MVRGDRWWKEPPWWAWATMAMCLVAIIVMLPLALNRSVPASDTSAGTTPERSGSPTTGSSPARTSSSSGTPTAAGAAQILVIGDVDTGGSAPGSDGWPVVVEERLKGVEVTVAATGDAGYVTTEAAAPTFPQLVERADLVGVDVVVVFGSRFDAAGIADQVSLAAGTVIGAIEQRAPDAELVVIGPAWPGAVAPAGIRNNRDVIRSAAAAAGVVFVDPITAGWLTDAPGLVGPDGEHLTAAADTYLADRIEPLIRSALGA